VILTRMVRGEVTMRSWPAERLLTFVFSTSSSVRPDQRLSTFHQEKRLLIHSLNTYTLAETEKSVTNLHII